MEHLILPFIVLTIALFFIGFALYFATLKIEALKAELKMNTLGEHEKELLSTLREVNFRLNKSKMKLVVVDDLDLIADIIQKNDTPQKK